MTTQRTLILLSAIVAVLLSFSAVQPPALHLITHMVEINSEHIFVTDITYDTLGRRIYQSTGMRNPKRSGHQHDSLIQRSSTTIRYAGDSMIYAFDYMNGGRSSRIFVLDSLGNNITAGSKVKYDPTGRVADEVAADYETHYIRQEGSLVEQYGWSRYNDRVTQYHSFYTYYDDYDTRSYGMSKGRQDRQHLFRQSTYIYDWGQKHDTVVTDYSYEYGVDGRILSETRLEHNSAIHHVNSWTEQYSYAD